MKKIILLLALVCSSLIYSQNFWTEVSNIFSDSNYFTGEISVVDNNVIWVNGKGTDYSSYARKWSRSDDGGVTWTSGNYNFLPSNAQVSVGGIKAISNNTAYVTTYAGIPTSNNILLAGVWRTDDGGITWSKQTSADFSSPASFPNFVHFWNANDGIVNGDPVNGFFEIYTTNNGGANWNLLPSANIPVPLFEEYAFPELFQIIGNTLWFGTSRGRIFKSIDKGQNWTVTQSPLDSFTACCSGGNDSGNFSFKNQDEGILRDSYFNYYKTLDSGNTWISINTSGTIRNFNINYVTNTPNTYFQFGKDEINTRGSSYSLDGGSNWIDLNTVDSDPIIPYSVKFQSGTVGYCIGIYTNPASNTISNNIYQPKFFRLTDPQQRLTGASLTNNNFETKTKINLYPNPTSGLVKISGNSISEITIVDVLGKRVYSEKYNSLNEVNINISNLNNGIYIATISTKDESRNSQKIIKN